MKTLTITYDEVSRPLPPNVTITTVGHGSAGYAPSAVWTEKIKNVKQWSFFGDCMVIDLEDDTCEVRQLKYIKSYSWTVEPENRAGRRKK